jgi:hypothetical protein
MGPVKMTRSRNRVALHRFERKRARRRSRLATNRQTRSNWSERVERGAEIFKALAAEVEKALPKEMR